MSGFDPQDPIAGPSGHARNIVPAESAALPRPDLAPGDAGRPAGAVRPAQGRLVTAPECRPSHAVIARPGYRRRVRPVRQDNAGFDVADSG